MQTAERNGSKIIIANDPDADRLAVAEQQPELVFGTFITEIDVTIASGTYHNPENFYCQKRPNLLNHSHTNHVISNYTNYS